MAKNSPKNRDYFITINEGAPCYESALEIIKELNYKIYALITHDKDVLINDDGTTTPKARHKHAVIELKNAITFDSMQKKFTGAHIEVPKYKKSAYQYLLHNLPSAREKYQYPFEDIITNSPEEVKWIIENETKELFKEDMFLAYIYEGVRTPYQFVRRFGMNAYKQYWSVYYEMIHCLENDEDMQRDYENLAKERANNGDLPF